MKEERKKRGLSHERRKVKKCKERGRFPFPFFY